MSLLWHWNNSESTSSTWMYWVWLTWSWLSPQQPTSVTHGKTLLFWYQLNNSWKWQVNFSFWFAPPHHSFFTSFFLFLGPGLGLGWGLYLLFLLSCNNLTGLLAFLPPSPMLQEKEASKQLGEHLALSYGWPIMVNEQVIFEKEFITGRQTNSFPSSLVFSYLNRKVKIVLVLTHTSTSSQLAAQGCSWEVAVENEISALNVIWWQYFFIFRLPSLSTVLHQIFQDFWGN